MSLSDYMYRDLTKGSIAKGLIWFALAGPDCYPDRLVFHGYYLRRRKALLPRN